MIRERNLDSLPTYGRLSFAKIKHLRTAIHFLIADGYLKRDGGESPLLHLTEKAEIVLERKAPVLGFAFGAEDVMASVAVEKKAILSETKSGIFENFADSDLPLPEKNTSRLLSYSPMPPWKIWCPASRGQKKKWQKSTASALSN